MRRNHVLIKFIASIAVLSITIHTFSLNLKDHSSYGYAVVQLGGYWSIQGRSQHINIDSLIGDDFTVTNGQSSNGLVGLGYFIDRQKQDLFQMTYGVNTFYLAKTGVSGNVIQESLFTNSSYGYSVTHYPVYAVAKSTITTKFPKYALTVDLGVGPNFMRTGSFKEQSLNGVITVPNNAFSGHTTTTFSVMTGIGIKFNNFFSHAPLDCGYKFFYLGQGNLSKNTNQLLNNLNTGNNYANALMCAITV